MRVTLVGTGCGDPGTMTVEVKKTIERADMIIGARRLLEAVEPYTKEDCVGVPEIRPDAILEAIRNAERGTSKGADSAEAEDYHICVAYSGDSGFYSGTRSLVPLLEDAGIESVVVPGISSVQVMAARLQRPWQDWKLVSAHGTDCDAVAEVMDGKEVFFLTGGSLGPAELCAQLADAGLGGLKVCVGERLSYEGERIVSGTAAAFAEQQFDALSVMLVEPAAGFGDLTPGIDDGEFIRGDIPMTKQTVRAAILSKMNVAKTDTVWDVGAGTGSVSVELAMKASRGKVWAVERESEGCSLIYANKKKFGNWNLNVVLGSAPEALQELPAPDRVFIGGSGGNLREIIDTVLSKNESALICVSAIVLETMADTVRYMAEKGMDTDIIQVCVNTSRKAGSRHMMMAANPIYIITGRKAEDPDAEGGADA